MAIIRDVVKKKYAKNIFYVVLDDGESVEAYDEFLVLNHLKIGEEISHKELYEIAKKSQEKIGMQYCLKTLSGSLKTRYEMYTKLIQKGLTQSVANEILDKVQSYGYIDDLTFAKTYTSQELQKKGWFRVCRELEQKGVSREIIDQFAKQNDSLNEFEVAFRVAEKYMRNKPVTFKNKTKLYGQLLSKGFGYDTIGQVLDAYKWSSEEC